MMRGASAGQASGARDRAPRRCRGTPRLVGEIALGKDAQIRLFDPDDEGDEVRSTHLLAVGPFDVVAAIARGHEASRVQ
jgi:hypothetical protein